MKKHRAPTISDVARVLGVSRSTVSRGFSRPDLLSEQTVKDIHAAAAKLGYRPNQIARALSTGRHGNIAILVPDVGNPFFPPIIRGAQQAADGGGYSVFLADSDEDPAREAVLLQKLAMQTEGFVLAASRMSDAKVREFAQMRPMVLVNRDIAGIPRVLIDTTAGLEEAVKHLAELGHRTIVYLSGPPASWADQQRRAAIRRLAQRLRLALEIIPTPRATFDGGKALVDAVVKSKATAAVTFDDFVAQGLLVGLSEAGVQVPQDFSVIGCDDVLGACTYPALTSISSQGLVAGRMAVEMLLEMLQSGAANDQRCVLGTHLVMRATTAAAAERGCAVCADARRP